MKSRTSEKLPLLGVGPIYVLPCLFLTCGGCFLDHYGYLKGAELTLTGGRIGMYIAGLFCLLVGLTLWISAVLLQKISAEIRKGNLVTGGVYSFVRNPIYSAFLFLFTGLLFFSCNGYLLLLPFVFWAYLSLLMRATEEKWLKEKFGEDYVRYLQRVNRVIPWFPRKVEGRL